VAASRRRDDVTISDHAFTATERPIQPEIPRSRFALGMARYPSDLEQLRLGGFCDGQETLPRIGLHRGRFSEGQESLGDADPEKHIRRRFSEGMEKPHTNR
jgi:hypothetical protein